MAFFHGAELMLAPGVLLTAVAVGLGVAYFKIRVLRENSFWKFIFFIAIFVVGLSGLFFLWVSLEELSHRWR